MQRLAQLALAAVVLSLPLAAQARTPEEGASVIVQTADLNLASAGDAKVFVRRLNTAAGRVCGSQPDRLDLSAMRIWKACAGEAFDRAISRSSIARDALARAQRGPDRGLAAR